MDASGPHGAPARARAGAARPRRHPARTGVRVVGVAAILAGGVVSGLPVTVDADASSVEMTSGAAPLAREEHAATVEWAQGATERAEAAERADRASSAREAAAAVLAEPKRAAWAERLEVIAHRGGTEWGPESTLATFRHAIEVGSDAIELDVRFTRDGVPVVIHDDTLDRTTNCSGYVTGGTLRQLKKCDAGSWYRPNPRPGERVPTLGEALAVIRKSSAEIYLHVKLADGAQARRLVYAVRDADMDRDRTTYVSDWHPVLANLRAAGAQRLGYAFHTASDWSARYDVLIPQDVEVTRALVAQAQKRGAYVVAVEGTPVTAGQLDDLGLDGFMANDLDAVLKRGDRLQNDDTGRDPDEGRDSDEGRDGQDGDGDDGKPGRPADDWDPNADWEDDDDWDPSGPGGPWVVGP